MFLFEKAITLNLSIIGNLKNQDKIQIKSAFNFSILAIFPSLAFNPFKLSIVRKKLLNLFAELDIL